MRSQAALNIVADAEFCVRRFLDFVVSDLKKHAASIGTNQFFIGYLENAKYPPNKNCIPCSRNKIVWKLAYLSEKITSLIKKHKIVRKVAYPGV